NNSRTTELDTPSNDTVAATSQNLGRCDHR
ncbi:MAG: hypothetical protein K0S70_4404, partial [Microbacterium sp.]|nr:hypothetical protein [Microbacterium sp.]